MWRLMKYYSHYGHKDFILCLGHKGEAFKRFFLNYNEALSSDFILSDGGTRIPGDQEHLESGWQVHHHLHQFRALTGKVWRKYNNVQAIDNGRKPEGGIQVERYFPASHHWRQKKDQLGHFKLCLATDTTGKGAALKSHTIVPRGAMASGNTNASADGFQSLGTGMFKRILEQRHSWLHKTRKGYPAASVT